MTSRSAWKRWGRPSQTADADTVRRTAHSIKGASTSLGTEKIGSLALHLEARAASGNLDEAPDLHRQMLDRFIGLEGLPEGRIPRAGRGLTTAASPSP